MPFQLCLIDIQGYLRALAMPYMTHLKILFIASFLLVSVGCTSSTHQISSTPPPYNWMQDIVQYKDHIPAEHPDSIESLFAITDEMRQVTLDKFGHLNKDRAAEKLAFWLIEKDGLDMQYDIDAQFSPIEAYNERKGNCLSFTILLSVLANELDIEIKYNQVDLPDIWQMNEQNGLLLYKHVNGVYKWRSGRKQIFDLAMETYDFGYPQRIVSTEFIAANLHSNRAIDALYKNDREETYHHIKMAISILPHNSDLWSNLGAVMSRNGEKQRAEQAFLYSLSLDPGNGVVASNLEKFYNEQGNQRKAKTFEKMALKARQNNPYFHYNLAQQYYTGNEFSKARKSINQATKLHNKDPRFFELNSLILQKLKKYVKAFKELEKAHALAANQDEKQRYYNKAERVAQLAAQHKEARRKSLNISGYNYPILNNKD